MVAQESSKIAGIDLVRSYILDVISDDSTLTLDMDFRLRESHPRYTNPGTLDGCYRRGYIRFAQIEDLRLNKSPTAPKDVRNLSIIYSTEFHDDFVHIDSAWGEVEVSASTIQVVVE